mmetsp:Transcript_24651/g.39815  ORF Transcript_24651/g.39815 Transcript_24651/m.39815 type:complete len:162 (+) Transcript_24651:123-608(+)|eukprot:CAMPEP_0202698394 /NCGR_PEP_ID=MMETSP1385-20130828/11686_1 /ASSEMBLY_ACC=CAM_ASM_000861 /TAXON_ID=933848 /ORGANISM="Elphidium margaritaceum" /LENGTH=161 /DNA_ID=CAMNT_0049355109 /DNA_START=94 /DNA_END=579 /DNA_ORIENTATION=+
MKYNQHVSSSRRKNRRRHFNAPSHVRRNIMGVALSKQLCREYNVPRLAVPIRRDDVVKVITGKYKDEQPSKVIRVHRKRYRLYIDNIQREKANGAQVKVPVHYSNVVITKLKLDGFRKNMLKEKSKQKRRARKRLGLDPTGVKQIKKAEQKEKVAAKVDLD